MIDLTDELERMADEGARQASPIAAAEILRRGDRRRRRSLTRLTLSAGVGVALVAAVIVGVAVLPSPIRQPSHQASHQPRARLAAWRVSKQAGGTVVVQIHELRDPGGLQAALRGDGIPVSVVFLPGDPTGKTGTELVNFPGNPCVVYSGGETQAQNVVVGDFFQTGQFTIVPSALPSGAGVQILVVSTVGGEQGGMFEWLVQRSAQCTGS